MSENFEHSPASLTHSVKTSMDEIKQEKVSEEPSEEFSSVQAFSPTDQAPFANSTSFSNGGVTEASALQTKKTPSEDVSSILGGILNRVGPVFKKNEEIKKKLDTLSFEIGKTDKILKVKELELQNLTEQGESDSAKKEAFDEFKMEREEKISEKRKLQRHFKKNRNEAKQIQRELLVVKELNGKNSQPQDPHLVGTPSGISQHYDPTTSSSTNTRQSLLPSTSGTEQKQKRLITDNSEYEIMDSKRNKAGNDDNETSS